MNTEKTLPLLPFRVRVTTVPPRIEQLISGAQITTRTITIYGYTLADAKKRAGIQ